MADAQTNRISEITLCDYLKLRITSFVARQKNAKTADSVKWKDFKRQWVVMKTSLSPLECSITYCNKEEDWIEKEKSLHKVHLCKKFTLSGGVKTSKGDQLFIEFEDLSMVLQFASLTKLQQWRDELDKIRCRTYSELVRCPQHPKLEAEYIMEICADRLKLWHPQYHTIAFQWNLQSVRRAQYHNKTGKIEIEVGRASETGEGNFYFIGHEIKDMFYKLKECIAQLSKSSSGQRRSPSNESIKATKTKIYPTTSDPATPDSDILLIQTPAAVPGQSTDEEYTSSSTSTSTGGTGDSSGGYGSFEPAHFHSSQPPGVPSPLTYSNVSKLHSKSHNTQSSSADYISTTSITTAPTTTDYVPAVHHQQHVLAAGSSATFSTRTQYHKEHDQPSNDNDVYTSLVESTRNCTLYDTIK